MKTTKIFIFIFFASIFIGCQTEEIEKHQQKESDIYDSGIQEKKLTLSDLENLPKAKAIIERINTSVSRKPKENIYNENYNFFVNTDNILMIENGSYHSLTFPIFRLENDYNITENLVLSLQDDGNYSVALYKYNLTEQNKSDILNNKPTHITELINRTILNEFNPNDITSRIIQTFYTEFVVVNCGSGEHHSGNMEDWHKCTATKKPEYYIITRSVLIEINDDLVPAQGSETSQGGPIGGGSEYNPNIPPFNASKDLPLIKGNITKPIVLLPTNEQTFFNDVLGDEGRLAIQDSQIRNPLLDFLKTYGFTEDNMKKGKLILDYYYNTGDLDFCLWAIWHFNDYGSTAEQFENWFMGSSEGQDEIYDSTYWDNPNLFFPQQILPDWSTFYLSFPSKNDDDFDTSVKMYEAVGGTPLAIFLSSGNENTCALRVSWALNHCGINIPNIPGKTFKGKDIDNKSQYYFLGAANLCAWMKKTFGIPTGNNHLTESDGGENGINFVSSLNNKKGIYIMIPKISGSSGFGASGHADMIENSECDNHCYFNAVGGVKDIYIWELQN